MDYERKKESERKRAKEYYAKNADAIKTKRRERYYANRQKCLANQAEYYKKNKDVILEKLRTKRHEA